MNDEIWSTSEYMNHICENSSGKSWLLTYGGNKCPYDSFYEANYCKINFGINKI